MYFRKHPTGQMIVATAILAAILIPSMIWVQAGTAKEQAAKAEENSVVVITEVITEEIAEEPEQEPIQEPTPYWADIPLDVQLQEYIVNTSEKNGIDPAIIMALIDRESDYNPYCVGDYGNSFGLCQIQPKWHSKRMEKLGCTDLLNPYHNVTVCIDYLCELLNKYGDMAKALTAYNRGHYSGTVTAYAKAVLEKAGELNAFTR